MTRARMTGLARGIAASVVSYDALWRLLDATVLRVGRRLDIERSRMRLQQHLGEREQLIAEALATICSDLVVRHGPFAGLRYPAAKAFGSELFPKLLGSYERELHGIIETLCVRDYSDVAVIGCAEGYYAVGLALRLPKARVHAFDIDAAALEQCGRLAAHNAVAGRVVVTGACSRDDLLKLADASRLLVLSDCEGFERTLFDPQAVAALARHDVLIEVHDFIDIDISTHLRRRFAPTHHVTSVSSVDDIFKVRNYEYRELEPYTSAQRRELLAERRPSIMEWFLFESKREAAV